VYLSKRLTNEELKKREDKMNAKTYRDLEDTSAEMTFEDMVDQVIEHPTHSSCLHEAVFYESDDLDETWSVHQVAAQAGLKKSFDADTEHYTFSK